jgi:hypothetical protein
VKHGPEKEAFGILAIADLMDAFSVGRATVYRTLSRAGRAVSEEEG